jgi:hypothetical protein
LDREIGHSVAHHSLKDLRQQPAPSGETPSAGQIPMMTFFQGNRTHWRSSIRVRLEGLFEWLEVAFDVDTQDDEPERSPVRVKAGLEPKEATTKPKNHFERSESRE